MRNTYSLGIWQPSLVTWMGQASHFKDLEGIKSKQTGHLGKNSKTERQKATRSLFSFLVH